MTRSLRGLVAVAGVGETAYYKRGGSPDPEFKLALDAIIKACADAGISPRDVDGFSSYSNDRSEPSRIAAALGCHELKFAAMQWGAVVVGVPEHLPMPPLPSRQVWLIVW